VTCQAFDNMHTKAYRRLVPVNKGLFLLPTHPAILTSWCPTQKPPTEARVVPMEATITSTWPGCRPAASQAPRPVAPSTPSA
jgi:hypothetical protein